MSIQRIHHRRTPTRSDLRHRAPALLWLMLGALVVVTFIAFAKWGLGPPL